MSDDIFSIIAKEIETGNTNTGLWTRAFGECDGDPNRTKALYIRLRHAELTAAQSPQTVVPPPGAPIPSDGLGILRLRLKNKLTETGKQSFYNLLGIPPDVSDAVVAAAIVRLNSRASTGEALSPEMRYAMDALETPAKREQYDRRLFSILNPAPVQKVESLPLLALGSSDGMLDGWRRTRTGRLILVVASMACVALLVGYFSKGAKKSPSQTGPALASNQPGMNSAVAERQQPTPSLPEDAPQKQNASGNLPPEVVEQARAFLSAPAPESFPGINPMDRAIAENTYRARREESLEILRIASGVSGSNSGRASKAARMEAKGDAVRAPQTPTNMTSCDPGGCWDNLGNRYNGNANGTMFRTDGKICQNIGGMVQCN